MSETSPILVVEDEKPMANALKMKLEGAGFSVHVANDGSEAVEYLQDTAYALVVLDLVMPTMDGFDVLEKMNELEQEPHVIVLSNLSQEEDKEKALNLGANDFFVKSNTSIADLVTYISDTLG